MKTIHLLFLLVISGLGFAPAAFGADPLTSSEQRLIGVWEEYAPSSNVVQFYPDRTFRLYLTKEEGAQMKIHWIEATWAVSPENALTMIFSAKGKSFTRAMKLVFQNDEMWLVGENEGATKHRRLNGDIPAKYRW